MINYLWKKSTKYIFESYYVPSVSYLMKVSLHLNCLSPAWCNLSLNLMLDAQLNECIKHKPYFTHCSEILLQLSVKTDRLSSIQTYILLLLTLWLPWMTETEFLIPSQYPSDIKYTSDENKEK